MESIRSVEPGGHHLGTEHTIRNFRTAFYRAELFDYNAAEQWAIDGSKNGEERANEKYKRILRDYEPPDIDQGIEDALVEFVERRKREIEGSQS